MSQESKRRNDTDQTRFDRIFFFLLPPDDNQSLEFLLSRQCLLRPIPLESYAIRVRDTLQSSKMKKNTSAIFRPELCGVFRNIGFHGKMILMNFVKHFQLQNLMCRHCIFKNLMLINYFIQLRICDQRHESSWDTMTSAVDGSNK